MTDYLKDLILLNCEQGSEEWHSARLGIPTATGFKKILSNTGKKSASAIDYMAELLAEYETGIKADMPTTDDMQRGNELEPFARAAYEFETDNEVIEVGGIFINENRNVMISPDGLIKGQKKGLEIKCPRHKTHIKYCLGGVLPSEYKLQVQGALWATGFDTWDFVSYCPEHKQPLFLITVERDKKLIEAIDKEVKAFSKTLEAHKSQLAA